jgi:histidinol phosphatase-like enzyme (inositol monophosphatase family)
MSVAEGVEARIAVALSLVEEAGRLTLGYFRRPLAVDNKLGAGAFDPVTAADREAEALLRSGLARAFPHDPIQGEEEGFTPGTGEWSWIIDPIDGTRAFISGMPAWGILVGLLHRGRPVAGIVRQPYLDETFVGGPAGAFLLRGGARRPLAASGKAEIGRAILYATHPGMFADPASRAGFERVAAAALMSRFGGDCYAYCLLAMGFVDLVIESSLQPYDIVPLIPVIEAAGGVVTGPDGRPPLAGGTVIAAGSAPLHAAALALMRGVAG